MKFLVAALMVLSLTACGSADKKTSQATENMLRRFANQK